MQLLSKTLHGLFFIMENYPLFAVDDLVFFSLLNDIIQFLSKPCCKRALRFVFVRWRKNGFDYSIC